MFVMVAGERMPGRSVYNSLPLGVLRHCPSRVERHTLVHRIASAPDQQKEQEMKTTVAILTTLALAAAATLTFADSGSGRGGMVERLKAADTNADGMISRDEAKALPRIASHFDAIDTNKDGQITMEELRAFHASHRGEHGGAMKKMDTDNDGKVSKAEALAAAAARFDAADTNKDGFLTQDEMKAARKGHQRGQ
jgi:Ca2+-binding EF-hand superfamily protein